jgi:hypothetical protein
MTWAIAGLILLVTILSWQFLPNWKHERSWDTRLWMLSFACCCSSDVRRPSPDGKPSPIKRVAAAIKDVMAASHLAVHLQVVWK